MIQENYIKVDAMCQVNSLPDGNYLRPGCKFIIKNGAVKYVHLLSDNMNKGIQFLQDNKISELYLNTFSGYEVQDTNCLFSLPAVTDIFIKGSWMDKSGLYSLKKLHKLDLDDWNSDVDLSCFPELHFFSGCYCKEVILPLDFPQLEKMRLWKYTKTDMTAFPHCPKLSSLQLIQARLKTLDGLERLNGCLKYLSLGYCRSLRDFGKLAETNIEVLELESISEIEQLQNILPRCSSLAGVSLNCPGKVLPSLGFLNDMPNLKCFACFLKDISDGDLTPTARLDNVFMPFIKKHYNLQTIKNKSNTTWSRWLEQVGMYYLWPPSR